MSKTILVADADPTTSHLAENILTDEGYTVIIAHNDDETITAAVNDQPHLILIDQMLPGRDAEELAAYLRKQEETADIPLVMLATEESLEDLVIGYESSVDDYLIKPFNATDIVAKLLPLLNANDTKKTVISSGNGELDSKMGGGIPVGSLTLIEGSSGAGKSVLSQQLTYGSLFDGFTVGLFTSENDVQSLVKQMRSLDLDILDFLLLNRFRIFPMELSLLGKQATRLLIAAMRAEVARHDMIIVDSLTVAIAHASDEDVLSFFEACKRMCGSDTTVMIVLHSHALNNELLVRLRSLCDAHLQLRTEEVGKKLVKTLEVTKVRGADKTTGNIVSFEVEPGWGMRVIPVNKVKG